MHVFVPELTDGVARRFVEGGDAQLAAALAGAAGSYLAAFTQGHAAMAVRVQSVQPSGPAQARVTFTITGRYHHGSYSEAFTGGAVQSIDGWKVSWSTVCFLVEFHNARCPPAPRRMAGKTWSGNDARS